MKALMNAQCHLLILLVIALVACQGNEKVDGDTTGVTDDQIVIGSWGPMTGPAALWGNILKGTDAYFKMINEDGGIHGRQIKFVFKDDAYDPSRTVPAVRELVQLEEVFAVAGGVGTATNMAVQPFLTENKVPWISPMTGATYWTTPIKENIFTSFPLYFDEGEIMTRYALEELSTEKIGIVYQNDDFGKSGLISAQHTLQSKGLDFTAAIPLEVTDTDLSSHVARLKESGAEVVLLWLLPRQAAIILGSSAVIEFKPTWMASLVLSDMALMHDITKGLWEGVIFNYPARVMYNDENSELMMKYKAAYAKHYPNERWGTFSAAGFLWVEILVEGLRQTGRDLSREAFLETMASIQNFTGAGGIPVSFSADNHLGTRAVCLMKCESATQATNITEPIEGNADISTMLQLLGQDH